MSYQIRYSHIGTRNLDHVVFGKSDYLRTIGSLSVRLVMIRKLEVDHDCDHMREIHLEIGVL